MKRHKSLVLLLTTSLLLPIHGSSYGADVMKPMTFFMEHPNCSVEVSPIKNYLVTWNSRSVKTWNYVDGVELQGILFKSDVLQVAFAAQGGQLIILHEEGILVLDARDITAPPIFDLKGSSFICVSKDFTKLATRDARNKNQIIIYNLADGVEQSRFTAEWEVWTADFHPNNDQIALAGKSSTFVEYNLADGKRTRIYNDHTKNIWRVIYNRDGSRIASASHDATIKIWSQHTGLRIGTIHKRYVSDVRFNHDCSKLLIATPISLLLASTEEASKTAEIKASTLRSVAPSIDGSLLFGGTDWGVVTWDAKNLVQTGALFINDADTKHQTRPAIAFSPKNGQLALGDYGVTVWRYPSIQSSPMSTERCPGRSDNVAFTADGKYVVASGGYRSCSLIDVRTGKAILKESKHFDTLWSLAASPTAPIVAFNSDGYILLWNYQDGRSIALGDDDKPLPHPRTGNRQNEFRNGPSTPTFSSDGTMLAFGTDNELHVWQLSPKLERVFKNDESTTGVSLVEFVPSSRRIVTVEPIYQNPRMKIWDLNTGRESAVATFDQRRSPVSVTCSPDGKLIVLAFEEGELMVCDAVTAQTLKVYRTPSSRVFGVKFSPDGKFLAVTSVEGLVFWQIEADELLKIQEPPSDAAE